MRGDGLELAGGRDASTGLLLSVRRSSGLQNWMTWQRAAPEFLPQVLRTVDDGVDWDSLDSGKRRLCFASVISGTFLQEEASLRQ